MVMLLCVLGLVAHAEMTVSTADGNGADTFVGNDSNKGPNNNYGDSGGLDIRYLPDTRAHIGYVRFDITDVGGLDLTGAQLQFDLYSSNTGGEFTWSIYGLTDNAVDDAWDEMAVTYNNIPGMVTTDPEANGNYSIDETKLTLLGTLAVPGGTGMLTTTTVDLDLDSFLGADLNGLVTFVLIDGSDSGKQWYVATKENAAGDPLRTAPTLILANAVDDPYQASNPNPGMHEVVPDTLTQLEWANPEPNLPGGVITCDVYFGTTEPNVLESDYGLEYTLATGTPDTFATLPIALAPLTQYYWVVDVHDSSQIGMHHGRKWSFNTFNVGPAVDAGEDQYVWLTKAIVSTEPAADTCMRDSTPRGADGLMDIHGSAGRAGYVRFDLSALTAMGPGTVENATLTFMKTTGGARNDTIVTSRVGLKGLDDVVDNTVQNWGEMTLSTDNVGLEHPGSGDYDTSKITDLDAENGAAVVETIVNGGAAGGTITITGADLEAFLQGRVDDNGLVTFIMSFPGTSGRGYALATKENTAGHAAPLLELTYVPNSAVNNGDAEVVLSGTADDDGLPSGTLDFLWSQVSGPEAVSIDPSNVEEVTVFISTPGTYEFQLEADDSNLTGFDIVQVYVGTNPCDAAQNTPGYTPITGDFDNSCIVDIRDLAEFAMHFMECNSLVCP